MSDEEEKRYTLSEARLELQREECAQRGHAYVVVGDLEPGLLRCSRCGLEWEVRLPK